MRLVPYGSFILFHDDTPEPGRLPEVYPRNPPRNILQDEALLHPSNLFAFEGLEGAGKSTLVQAVVSELGARKRSSLLAILRGSDITAHALERAKWKNSDPYVFNLINWVGLFDQTSDLAGLLNGDRVILFDRYTMTVRVRGMLEGMDESLMDMLEPMVPSPKKVFFVDCDPEICVQRIASGGRNISYFEAGNRDAASVGAPLTEADESVRRRSSDRSVPLLRHLYAMRSIYDKVLRKYDNVVIIDNTRHLETSVATVLSHLD